MLFRSYGIGIARSRRANRRRTSIENEETGLATVSQFFEELYPIAVEAGIDADRFWEMDLLEIMTQIEANNKRRLEEWRAKAYMDHRLSELMAQTGNPVTDVIVNDTRRRSLDLGIRFQVDFHYPEPGAYDAFDMGIILQNLLQNALEACEKVSEGKRFIVLTGKRKGRFFLIEVKNSFVGEVVFGQDGLPVTTKKEDAPMHGIGLSNVRREAEKYMGELELKTTNQREFSATVLLQERSSL